MATALFGTLQAGCLLADARDVPLTTKRLHEIEEQCFPWHFLFSRSVFVPQKTILVAEEEAELVSLVEELDETEPSLRPTAGQGDGAMAGGMRPRSTTSAGIRDENSTGPGSARPRMKTGRELSL